MTRREEKVVERFAVVDEGGIEHQIVKVQEYIISEGGRIPSLGRYQLLSGGAVNRVDDNTFELVSLGGVAAKRK